MKPEEFLNMCSPEYIAISKDCFGETRVYKAEPIKHRAGDFTQKTSDSVKVPVPIEWDSDDWTKCVCFRKPDMSQYIGKLVAVSDNGKDWDVGVLAAVEKVDNIYYYLTDLAIGSKWSSTWKYCRPLTEEEKERLL